MVLDVPARAVAIVMLVHGDFMPPSLQTRPIVVMMGHRS